MSQQSAFMGFVHRRRRGAELFLLLLALSARLPLTLARTGLARLFRRLFDDAPDLFMKNLTVEEVGQAGAGLVTHLTPIIARRLRTAIGDALKEIGEPT